MSRSIHYCGGCGEELFDDMECFICNHPFVKRLQEGLRVMNSDKTAKSDCAGWCPKCNCYFYGNHICMDVQKEPTPTGVGLEIKYFVLNPKKNTRYGAASRAAMLTYAAVIRSVDPRLAEDLVSWVEIEERKLGQ